MFQFHIVYFLIIFSLVSPPAMADVQSSKANAYTVLGLPAGVSSSKMNAYTVLGLPAGVSSSKVTAYTVLGLPAGVALSKVIGYAVITSQPYSQPNVYINTKAEPTPDLRYLHIARIDK